MNKKQLSESDICDRFISPALTKAGWENHQWRREFSFTDGRIIVRGKMVARGQRKRADYLLFYKPNLPIALIEAKDNNHAVAVRDATPREEISIDREEEEQLSKNEQRQHLRRFSMFRIGLKVGDQLTFARDESLTATVISETELEFDGEVRSISASALAAIKKCGYNWKTIPGPIFWMYKGQSLKEIESEQLRGS